MAGEQTHVMQRRTFTALFVALSFSTGCQTPRDEGPRQYKGDHVSLETVFRSIGIAKTDVVADMAWEDGKAAIHAAQKFGIKAKAYPDDAFSFWRAKYQARAAGVSENVSVEWPRQRVSLGNANVVFYAPSPLFSPSDLGAAIKSGASSGKVISTERLRITGVDLDLVGESDGLHIYRWGGGHGVRDTVPPPKDLKLPLPPKPAAPK
jgi:hypothetical protein